jgi:alanyl-tRNA synthetase
MTSYQIRQQFLSFFEEKKHKLYPSAPIVLKDDPTLMFTNAGMNQFKDFLLGYQKTDIKRVANSQKCLRVSGKHNDLDDVGKDTYHHTMFEMLGNWSFGEYFKEDAISWAWELLTEVYKLPKENLYATVFEGDTKDGTEKDNESLKLWQQYLPNERILMGNKKDNFWEMGDTGPCGPSSEIHIDIRSEEEKKLIPGKDLVNNDHPLVIEIWNLVFMEFMRKANGELEKLPNKNVDTGMGFERLAMVIQNKKSNYDTDIFVPLISKIEKLTNKKYNSSNEVSVAMRVIADHVRAISFSIADGQLPSNNGAGYVIRRILRRAIGYGFRFLDKKEPFVYALVEDLVNQMGDFFPEIKTQQTTIEKVIKEEETNFLRTLEIGLIRLDQIILEQIKSNKTIIEGSKIFELYDTYGFPADLSRIIAEEKNLSIDELGFEKEMEKQKVRSRGASEVSAEDWVILQPNEKEEFVGYDKLESEIKLTRYRKTQSKKGVLYQLVFDQTPFYPEGGGQVGDVGFIENEKEKIEILDTKKENNLIIHITNKLPLDTSSVFSAYVDIPKRRNTIKNHSATHLLQEALREVLGNHIVQKGSLVNDQYLRFDFAHFQKLTKDEIKQVEEKVNQKIQLALSLEEDRNADYKKVVEKGFTALFGEKYGDVVRTIKFGTSMELCGGTHVKNTSEIGLFYVKSESSVASGIRRIEAITGENARRYFSEIVEQNESISKLLQNPEDVIKSIENLKTENEELKKQLASFIKEKANSEKIMWKNSIKNLNGINFLATKTELDNATVKDLAFSLRKEIENLFLVVVSTYNNVPTITVALSDALVSEKQMNASQIVKDLAIEIKGGGGGQPFFATAGGRDLLGVENVMEKAKLFLSNN